MSLDPRVTRSLRRPAEAVAFRNAGPALAGGDAWLLLAVTRPSTQGRPTDYCGSGTETTLYLLRWSLRRRQLNQADELLVQSCLQSLVLQSDAADEQTALVYALQRPGPVVFAWQAHPLQGDKSRQLSIREGKMVLEPVAVQREVRP
ncbi:hypothetical protein AAW51_0018 [Caldimonas brevitalea]|uniref:Uncharacterized protein n=1 Tax=Caldimonas brevitalea TaxID=413882 RepID=A0A0G3BBG8_9BURK|nr:hypothetical protein AAW51_0018 [Caldimonas brevitalea]